MVRFKAQSRHLPTEMRKTTASLGVADVWYQIINLSDTRKGLAIGLWLPFWTASLQPSCYSLRHLSLYFIRVDKSFDTASSVINSPTVPVITHAATYRVFSMSERILNDVGILHGVNTQFCESEQVCFYYILRERYGLN